MNQRVLRFVDEQLVGSAHRVLKTPAPSVSVSSSYVSQVKMTRAVNEISGSIDRSQLCVVFKFFLFMFCISASYFNRFSDLTVYVFSCCFCRCCCCRCCCRAQSARVASASRCILITELLFLTQIRAGFNTNNFLPPFLLSSFHHRPSSIVNIINRALFI